MSESTVKYPASLVPVGAFAGKPALPLTRQHIVVGSGKHARILLKSDTVSSVHTLLIQSDGRWYFRDLVSRTHTILNGKSIRESELKNGDTITIGSFVFHFVAPAVTEPPMKVAPAALDITDAEIPVPIDTKTVLIGKRPGCEIRLMEEGVSTAHAIIFECNGHHFIRDLYSRGGTLLNGKKIHQEVLKFGDVVVVGETIIKYIPDESAEFVPAEEASFAPSVVAVEATRPGGLLDESAMPVIAHDEAMASHEGPLAGAEDLFAPSVPETEVEADAEAVEVEPLAEALAPAKVESAPTKVESSPVEIPAVRKPAEIRASLPPGLSSLLESVSPPKPLEVTRPSPIVEQSIPLADETPLAAEELSAEDEQVEAESSDLVDELPTIAEAKRDLLEPLPIEEDDLVVPLRRREASESVEARVEPIEVEPSSIAPEVDEVRAGNDVEIDDEVESASPTSIEPELEVVEPVANVGSPAVANQAVDVSAAAEAVEAIDTVDEVELATDEVELATDEVELATEAVEPEQVEVAPDQVQDTSDVVAVEPEAVETEEVVATESDLVATQDDVVETQAEAVAADDVAAVEPDVEVAEPVAETKAVEPVAEVEVVDAEETKTVEVSPLDVQAFAEAIRRDFAEVDERSEAGSSAVADELVADESERVAEIDAPVAENETTVAEIEPAVAEVESAAVEPAQDESALDANVVAEVPSVEPVAAVEASIDADKSLDELPNVAAPVAEEPVEEAAVAEAPADETVSEEKPAEPLATIEQSPELKQLAELQARIAQALQDPSSVSRDPIMPPDAPLVSDPASAMSAAARRARLIAEMLDTTEPLEEEAEREAQSITFDIDESESPPPVEPISEMAEEAEAVAAPEIESEVEASPELIAATDEAIEPISIEESVESSVAIDDAMTVADASTNIDEPLAIESANVVPLVPLTLDEPIATADLSIDIADTLPADLARGVEAVSIPLADLIAPETSAAEQLVAPQDESEIDVPSFALPNAVELSEFPIFESGDAFELKADAASTQPAAELELPAAEALDAPLDIDEIEPTLQGSDHEDLTPVARSQDVFDAESIAAVDAPVADAPIEPAMRDRDEVVEAGQIVDEPIGSAPLIDADEPVSESADDALVESNPVLGIDLAEAAAALESNELVVDTTEPLVEPMGELLGKTEIERAESVEDDVFATSVAEAQTPAADVDEIQHLDVEEIQHLEVESAADMAAEPEDASFIDIAPIAPIEPDQYKAGEVIAVATDVNPGDAPVDEIESSADELESSTVEVDSELTHTVDLEAVAEVAPTQTPSADEVRIVVEADEEESLEGQSRPLIAAEEHLVEDELEELPSIAAAEPAAESVEAAEAVETVESIEPVAETIEVVAETTSAFEEASPIAEAVAAQADEPSVEEPAQTIEVDITGSEVAATYEPETSPFAQEAPAEEVAQSGPIVAEGTTEAAKTPTTIEEPADPRLPRPSVINVNVPSMEKLQAEFDDAFAEALAMAEGKSFAGTKPPKAEPSVQVAKAAEPVQPTAEAEIATERPVSIQQTNTPRPSNLIDVKVPSLDKLEAEFKDSFAEALAMAEGHSFAKPRAEAPKPTGEPTSEATPAAEAPKPAARPQRKLPEFKLDESLLDQAEKMGGMGGSTAPMAPAAFMNLGGIGWIGDETLDDYEILDRKPGKPKRRSRQRRPVGDVPTTPTVAESQSASPASETERPQTVVVAAKQAIVAPSEIAKSTEITAESEQLPASDLDLDLPLADLNDVTAADELDTKTDAFAAADDAATSTLDFDDSAVAEAEAETLAQTPEAPVAETKPSVPMILPPRPNRPRKGEAVVDQALSPATGSPFAAQELPLVDAFSGMPTPQLDDVLARLNTNGGAVKDHPPITQDRPLSEGKEVKVPVSPFASQIPIAQSAGNVRRVRQRMSKLPLIGLLMLIAAIAMGTFTWYLPVPQLVRGEVKFKNLDSVTELVRKEMQRDILAKLDNLQQPARSNVEDMDGGGFLDFEDPNQKDRYVEIVSNARFESQNLLILEVPSNVNQAKADQRRLSALLAEVVKANKNLSDAVNKMTQEARETEIARAKLDSEIKLKDGRAEELRAIGDTGAIESQLKRVNKELATLDDARKQTTRVVDETEAELKRLETQMLSSGTMFRGWWMRPVPGVILADASGTVPSTQPIDAGANLAQLKRDREDLKARLERLTAARSPEMAAARESFDRSLEDFSKQVEDARAALGDRPEVLEYVQSATRLQTQIREMTDTLVRRQEQQITRLNEFQMRLKELTESNKEQRINGDPQLKESMDDLAFQERRLNVARESNAEEQVVTEIERNIAFLKSQIAAKQELLASPKEKSIVGDLEEVIESTRRDMAVDRERNEVLLAEVQNAFQSRQPVLEALPAEQRQLTQSFTDRLAQINLARQRYTDSLAAASGTDEALIADANKQLQSINQSIAQAEVQAQQDVLAQSQEMEKRTEIAKRVDEARTKVLAARAKRDEVEKEYYTMLASRDALATKVAEGANARIERDTLVKEKTNLEEQRSRLIARKKELESQLGFAVVVNPADNRIVIIDTQSDPRLKYFGLAFISIIAVGAGFVTMEVRNRIPVPASSDERSSNSDTPLSGTPTVA